MAKLDKKFEECRSDVINRIKYRAFYDIQTDSKATLVNDDCVEFAYKVSLRGQKLSIIVKVLRVGGNGGNKIPNQYDVVHEKNGHVTRITCKANVPVYQNPMCRYNRYLGNKNIPEEVRNEYKVALRRGYLEDWDESWSYRTFVGCFLQNIAAKQNIKILDVLKSFVGEVPRFDNITDDILYKVRNYYEDMVKNGKMAINTAAQYLIYIRIALSKAPRTVPFACEDYARILTLKKDSVQDIFLTTEEVIRIDEYEPRNATEDAVKTLFMRECLCGARTSECQAMSKNNVHGNTLTYYAEKNKSDVSLPIHQRLIKYLDKPIKNIDDFKINPILREIGKQCGLNELVTLHRKGKTETKPKYMWLHTHAGRKSFVTNLYLKGVEPMEIRGLTGHKSISTTERYIVSSRKLSNNAMSFFND